MANDDWRVTVTLHDAAHTERAAQSLNEHEVEDEVRRRLGHRIALSEDGEQVFLYAGTEDAAREADRVVREALEQRGMQADFALDRWHPDEEEWEDAAVSLPRSAEERQAEHQRLEAEEARESLTSGYAEFEVRVELPSHREAVQLAERLHGEGYPVIRRWKFLVIGTNTDDDAARLAEQLKQEAPADASIRVEMAGSVVPFILF